MRIDGVDWEFGNNLAVLKMAAADPVVGMGLNPGLLPPKAV